MATDRPEGVTVPDADAPPACATPPAGRGVARPQASPTQPGAYRHQQVQLRAPQRMHLVRPAYSENFPDWREYPSPAVAPCHTAAVPVDEPRVLHVFATSSPGPNPASPRTCTQNSFVPRNTACPARGRTAGRARLLRTRQPRRARRSTGSSPTSSRIPLLKFASCSTARNALAADNTTSNTIPGYFHPSRVFSSRATLSLNAEGVRPSKKA